jgi:hypothetical protein
VLEYALTTLDSSGNLGSIASINGGPLAGFRNRIINGAMLVNQRGSTSLSSGVSTVTYLVDRWFGFATGAAVNLSYASNGFRVTGAASNTAALIGQRIEATNSFDLNSATATLSFLAASSNSVTLNWKVSYADSVDDFTSVTQSNTGTVSTTPSQTRYSATFTLSGAATTGVQIEFFVNNFTSGTFDINEVQLEPGPVATPFERRPIGTELALCQRYYETGRVSAFATATNTHHLGAPCFYKVTKRAVPNVELVSVASVQFPGTVGAIQAPTTTGFNEVRVANNTGANGQFQSDFTASAEL